MITIWWNVTMVTMVGTHITYNIMHLYYFVFRTCYLKYDTHQLLRLKSTFHYLKETYFYSIMHF